MPVKSCRYNNSIFCLEVDSVKRQFSSKRNKYCWDCEKGLGGLVYVRKFPHTRKKPGVIYQGETMLNPY